MFSLVWKNVKVEINIGNEAKLIVDNVSGFANSGSLLAIIGTSGCGKTTLLGALSGRLKDRSGLVQINNAVISSDTIKNVSGYVQQFDVFVETLTVKEHLNFMAAMQLHGEPRQKRCLIVKQLLLELGLELQAHTTIRHLSGGEKRRLSLAAKLLNDPPILFCDEPTTGLDSYGAVAIMQKLQAIALTGKIVIATVHQPSSQLIETFHDILLMSAGKVMFQGSTDQAADFFESIDLKCPVNYSQFDFYLKCINTNGKQIRERFETVKKELEVSSNRTLDEKLRFCSKKPPFFQSLNWLLWRNSLTIKRDFINQLIAYLLLMIIAATVSLTYSSVKVTDRNSIQNIQGALISIVSELAFTNMYAVINLFPGDVIIFLEEKHLYGSGAYFLSKFLSLIPVCLLSSFGFTFVIFLFMDFLSGYELWLKMTISLFLIGLSCCGLGMAFSANCERIEHAELLISSIEIVLVLYSGFWINLNTISLYVSWIKYLSPFYYGFESMSNLYWRNAEFNNCNVTTIKTATVLPCFTNGTEVLDNYGIYNGPDVILLNFIHLNLLTLAFCLVGWAGIVRRAHYSTIY